MLRKILGPQKKNTLTILQSINLTKITAQYYTEHSDLYSLLQSCNPEAPPMKYFLKDMKKQGFTPCFLLKCAVVTNFFLQNQSAENYPKLLQFATLLMQKCNVMIEYLSNNYTVTDQNSSKNTFTNSMTTTAGDQNFWMGKTYFLLKQIIRPYLAYLLKFATFIQDQHKQNTTQPTICEIWRDINLLNSIYGFTSNFTTIGRYYLQELGSFVVLVSQTLSVDIKRSYERIQDFIILNCRLVCVHSDLKEEQQYAQEFCRILQEIGSINQKFNQFYMGKYFHKYLQHIQQPRWIDVNSPDFDRIFSVGNKQNCQPSNKKPTKSAKSLKSEGL